MQPAQTRGSTAAGGFRMDGPPPQVAPVLSTPETHIFEDPIPQVDRRNLSYLDEEQLHITYEIQRTVSEIRAGRWRRIALQFPDHMLVDAPRVFEALRKGLGKRTSDEGSAHAQRTLRNGGAVEQIAGDLAEVKFKNEQFAEAKLYILADTSYGACCVDEIAAEHVDADVVVHYGRSCLSPTARLPVIYVFTTRPLSIEPVVQAFQDIYQDRKQKIVLMADIPFSGYVNLLYERLCEEGYGGIFPTGIVHDPSSPLPNRTIPDDVAADSAALRDYQLFHISEPPTSLSLTLSSRVGAIHVYPTDDTANTPLKPLLASSAGALRRRYALVTSLSTVSIFGILINTLSVKNYLHIMEHVKKQIAAAGKKSYTFVVGKVNAAKVANFSEVGGWVVIGCWESSLVDSRDFWKPVITPFELELALKSDTERLWTGEWTSDFQAVLEKSSEEEHKNGDNTYGNKTACDNEQIYGGPLDSEEESAPPEFDLRTGRYVSHTRPMKAARHQGLTNGNGDHPVSAAKSLIKRGNGDLATVGGQVSPGAEFLRSKRTWQGLGSDFEIAYQDDGAALDAGGAKVEEGRSGIARGYTMAANRSRT